MIGSERLRDVKFRSAFSMSTFRTLIITAQNLNFSRRSEMDELVGLRATLSIGIFRKNKLINWAVESSAVRLHTAGEMDSIR